MSKKYLIWIFGVTLGAVISDVHASYGVWDKSTIPYVQTKIIQVYRGPDCDCCKLWIEHLRKHQFNVVDIETGDLAIINIQHKISLELVSCHTAFIDGYIIVGHVPANAINQLLIGKPNIRGIAVPQMLTSIPGMEKGDKMELFRVEPY